MTVSVWQERPLHPLGDFDDIVIGAGIVGAWAATTLAARGRSVALTEAHVPAAGASGRNGGFVVTNQREPYPELIERVGRERARELFQLVAANVATMQRLTRTHGVPTREGVARLAEDPAYADLLERWAAALAEDGFEVEFDRRDPFDAGFLAFMRVRADFVFSPAPLAERVAAASAANIFENNEIFHIEHHGAGVRVHGRRGVLAAERAWICANGYAGALHPALRAVVQPGRGQILLTPPAPPLLPMAGISGTGYFRQLDDGRLMIGGGRLQFEAREYTAEDATTPDLQRFLLDLLAARFPSAPQTIERAWAGIQGFTPDRRAIVGLLPGMPRVAFAVGFSGYGNSIGLVAAERMIEQALDGADPGPLDARRFPALQ